MSATGGHRTRRTIVTTPTPATTGKPLAITSLILGILSAAGALIVLPILFLLAGIAAVILGFLSRRRESSGKGMALAGIILGFVGIALSVISWIIGAIIIGQAMM
jgi:apolipoprotein N-acyltransferase